ncbi:MAG TPA: hypothetical protein VEI26_03700 [Terriglobales bacterium]|nr:hypothetical protein [Terriglobales bacterium]
MSGWSAKRHQIVGWAAVSISTLVACFWAFWGSIENFHEGWFYTSVWQNISLMFVQYLSPMLIVMVISILALLWRRLALPLLGAFAVVAAWLFRGSHAAITLIVIPLLGLGILYHFGRPEPRRWAWRCLIGLPLSTMVVCGAYPGWRAIHRFDDGNYGMRQIQGNGVTLVWAPEGPGWPSHYASWQDAERACKYLAGDGRSLTDQPQNLWRLPTVDEAVRSMVFRGRNAGGTWDPVLHRANYRVQPDKDSPLWRVHSQVIYWWTDTQADSGKAYRIAYNGYVFPFDYKGWGDYWAYRCVCEPFRRKLLPVQPVP